MVRYKYPPEMLRAAAAESRSIAGVLRQLGISLSGGAHAHISRQLKRFDIDTSHFTGAAHNRGGTSSNRLSADELLVLRPPGSRRTPGTRLRRAMLDIGLPERCERCGIAPTWRGAPLTLHVDHINGDFLDNRPRNVRFLCPNCHSQTPTYAGCRRDPAVLPDVVYDDAATTPTGIPLGRRLPSTPEWSEHLHHGAVVQR
jgi:hypothetical protein